MVRLLLSGEKQMGHDFIKDNENGAELNGRAPWWAKTLWVVGPITAIALGLVWLLAIDVKNDVKYIRETTTAHQLHTEALHRNIEDYMRIQNLLTRQLCVNAADTTEARNSCFQ